MSAPHTPTTTQGRAQWCVGAGDPTYVFIPGIVKPITVGSAERAAFIVRACNSHDELVDALQFYARGSMMDYDKDCGKRARAAIAKAT